MFQISIFYGIFACPFNFFCLHQLANAELPSPPLAPLAASLCRASTFRNMLLIIPMPWRQYRVPRALYAPGPQSPSSLAKNKCSWRPVVPGAHKWHSTQPLPHPRATDLDSNRPHLLAVIFVPWPAEAHTRAYTDAASAVAGHTPFGWQRLGPVPIKHLSVFAGAVLLQCA